VKERVGRWRVFADDAPPRDGLVPLARFASTRKELERWGIAQVKAGERQAAADALVQVLAQARAQGLTWAILGCTELCVAARGCEGLGPCVVDSTRALALGSLAAILAGLRRRRQSPPDAIHSQTPTASGAAAITT
jgi:hypothetical protein